MDKTRIIVTTCIITLGIYDLVVVSFSGVDRSISRYLQDTALDSPIVTFTFGFICGHIFGYMKPKSKEDRNSL